MEIFSGSDIHCRERWYCLEWQRRSRPCMVFCFLWFALHGFVIKKKMTLFLPDMVCPVPENTAILALCRVVLQEKGLGWISKGGTGQWIRK